MFDCWDGTFEIFGVDNINDDGTKISMKSTTLMRSLEKLTQNLEFVSNGSTGKIGMD